MDIDGWMERIVDGEGGTRRRVSNFAFGSYREQTFPGASPLQTRGRRISIDLSIRRLSLTCFLFFFLSLSLSLLLVFLPFLVLSIYRSICLSIYPSIYLSIYLSIYGLSIHLIILRKAQRLLQNLCLSLRKYCACHKILAKVLRLSRKMCLTLQTCHSKLFERSKAPKPGLFELSNPQLHARARELAFN